MEKKNKNMETGRLRGSIFSASLKSFGQHQYLTDEMNAKEWGAFERSPRYKRKKGIKD